MADTTPSPGTPSIITRFRTSDHWAVSLTRDLLQVVCVVGGIALALFLICGTWPAVVTIESGSMVPHMNVGDLVFVVEKDRFSNLQTWDDGKITGYKKFSDYGDVIIYRPNGYTDFWAKIGLLPFSGQRPIIHRAMTWTAAGEPVPRYVSVNTGSGTRPADIRDTGITADHGGYITKGDNNTVSDQGSVLGGIGTIEPVRKEWVVGKALFAIPLVGLLPLHIRELVVIVILLLVLHELYLRRKEPQPAGKPEKNGRPGKKR